LLPDVYRVAPTSETARRPPQAVRRPRSNPGPPNLPDARVSLAITTIAAARGRAGGGHLPAKAVAGGDPDRAGDEGRLEPVPKTAVELAASRDPGRTICILGTSLLPGRPPPAATREQGRPGRPVGRLRRPLRTGRSFCCVGCLCPCGPARTSVVVGGPKIATHGDHSTSPHTPLRRPHRWGPCAREKKKKKKKKKISLPRASRPPAPCPAAKQQPAPYSTYVPRRSTRVGPQISSPRPVSAAELVNDRGGGWTVVVPSGRDVVSSPDRDGRARPP